MQCFLRANLMGVRYLKQKKLTAKQKRFADEYLIDLNGTQACIRAGYSPKTASEQSSRLLTNVNVKEYIATELKKFTIIE